MIDYTIDYEYEGKVKTMLIKEPSSMEIYLSIIGGVLVVGSVLLIMSSFLISSLLIQLFLGLICLLFAYNAWTKRIVFKVTQENLSVTKKSFLKKESIASIALDKITSVYTDTELVNLGKGIKGVKYLINLKTTDDLSVPIGHIIADEKVTRQILRFLNKRIGLS